VPFGGRQALPSRPTPTLTYRLAPPSPPHPAQHCAVSVVRPGRPARCWQSTATSPPGPPSHTQSIYRAGASGALLLTPSPRGPGRQTSSCWRHDRSDKDVGRGARSSCLGGPPYQQRNTRKEWGARRANYLNSEAKRNCPASLRSVRHDGHPVCAGSLHHDAARPKHVARFWEALALQADAINMSTGSWCGWSMGYTGALSAAL